MKILAIDTSTKFLSLALADDEKILASFHRNLEQQHCAKLIPEIDKLLKKAKVKLKNIDCFAISKGPGSFTGLRIGAATVKGLALATKKPMVGVPTLDVMAYNIKKNSCFIAPIVDAKRGNVYATLYSFACSKLKRHTKYLVLPIGEFLNYVKDETIFLGDGIVPYKNIIKDKLKKKAKFAKEKEWYPRAAVVAKLAFELIKRKKFEDPDKFTPLYLYPKDVQCRR